MSWFYVEPTENDENMASLQGGSCSSLASMRRRWYKSNFFVTLRPSNAYFSIVKF